jgi:hypothetical protein
MAQFIDVHTGMKDITKAQLAAAHLEDEKFQAKEGVRFVKAWADPASGKVFCLSEAPDADAVKRVHQKAGHPTDDVYPVPLSTD